MPDFARRSETLELMDDPSCDEGELRHTLVELETINRWLGGYAPSVRGVASLVPPGTTRLSILDVGTGGGDVPLRLHRWASRCGLTVEIVGIDLSEPSIAFAREKNPAPGLEYRRADLFDLPVSERFDIVHAALLLHHFLPHAAGPALRRMVELSRWGVVINDLHRHPVAYHSIRWLTRLLSHSRLICNDAPLSVLRGFRRRELEALAREQGAPESRIRWRWPFRWQVVIPR